MDFRHGRWEGSMVGGVVAERKGQVFCIRTAWGLAPAPPAAHLDAGLAKQFTHL